MSCVWVIQFTKDNSCTPEDLMFFSTHKAANKYILTAKRNIIRDFATANELKDRRFRRIRNCDGSFDYVLRNDDDIDLLYKEIQEMSPGRYQHHQLYSKILHD